MGIRFLGIELFGSQECLNSIVIPLLIRIDMPRSK